MKNYGIDEKYLLLLKFKSLDSRCFEKYYKTPIGLFSIYVSLDNNIFWIYTYNKDKTLNEFRKLKLIRLPKILDWFEGKERK